jgi:hypothetical protein
VSQNQVIAGYCEKPCYGRLYQVDWQRDLVGTIIEIRHLTFRAQLLHDLPELWSAV